MDYFAARQNMVESQVRVNDVTDTAIQKAMRTIARERLCAPSQAFAAYGEVDAEISPGRFLMKPRDVSKLIHALEPKAGETALCLAAPYAAAVMAEAGLSVTAQEGDARARTVVEPYLKELGVTVVTADLKAPVGQDYDVIITEGAVTEVPAEWVAALKVGGRLAVVHRQSAIGHSRVYIRLDQGVSEREVFDSMPRMLPGFEKAVQFEF